MWVYLVIDSSGDNIDYTWCLTICIERNIITTGLYTGSAEFTVSVRKLLLSLVIGSVLLGDCDFTPTNVKYLVLHWN